MKTLPDNPDLGHLKQQAKDLLAGLRDSDPATSLATAQKALAAQYGFRTWTDLKAEVDRTRGRAAIADPALAQAIADRYDLGAVTGEMRSLARPDESGRAWSLETDRGRWVARTMDTWWPIVHPETEVALQEAAAAAGVPLPAPVRDRDGEILATIGGHEWRVCVWAHSRPPMAAPASAAVTRTVGTILATVHGLAMPVDRVSPWHEQRLSSVTWAELADRAHAEGAGWASAMSAAVPVLTELATVGAGVPAPEPVLSHNAMGPGQVRRGRHGSLVVLGWEHAGGQPPAWELANALMDWTVDPGGGVNVAGARALVDGYRETAGTLPDLFLSSFRGAVTGLANYVSGLVDFALTGTGDEDRRYSARSVRHVLAHLPTRAALERLVEVVR
ncbi:phosphotransferase [Actinophytocola sp. NPDC049390]|uniref:phosphotransferase n=1 Tax=Actinophytocola sp. NPDC049390 TaxID=3363894 RepID=UPI00379A4754